MKEHDQQIRELFAQGLTGRAIGKKLGIHDSLVWAVVRRLKLPARRGTYTCSRKLGEHSQITRMDSAARHFREPVTLDLSPDESGWIVYIGDTPGCVCKTVEAAVRSAVAAKG